MTEADESKHKDPWFDEMTPAEVKAHYEWKLERIEELSEECKRNECTNTARFPRSFCSNECMNVGVQEAVERLEELMGETNG